MRSKLPRWLLLASIFLLCSCDVVLLNTKGAIATQQRDLMLTTLGLMLIVVIPVIALTLIFAFKYRASQKAKYTPDWDHNTLLEVTWWSIPIVIIVILAVITWKSSHELDPYRPLESSVKPIEIQVVALEWKWLFIYPEQGVAVVNHLEFPAHVPINFKITGQAPMNSFWIPQLAGQIYAMEGMQTLLSLIADEPGNYDGMSANFSGEGFNGMKFVARVGSATDFARWIDSVKTTKDTLTRPRYDLLVKPSENDSIHTFGAIDSTLFMSIMMSYMMPANANDGMPANCPMRHHATTQDSSSQH